MAVSPFVTSARQKLRVLDVQNNRPNSEAINAKIAGAVNFVQDSLFFTEDFVYNGFIVGNGVSSGLSGVKYIEKDSVISHYLYSVAYSGINNKTAIDVLVYDSTGALITGLFGSGANQISISGSGGNNVVVGKSNVDTASPSNIFINTVGHSVSVGNPSITTIPAGSILISSVTASAANAFNGLLRLRFKEL